MYVHVGVTLEVLLALNCSLIDAPNFLRLKRWDGGSTILQEGQTNSSKQAQEQQSHPLG
jgi:hypothetical protein